LRTRRSVSAAAPANKEIPMPSLRESLSLSQQLACAIRQQTPIQLAQTFAAFEGQFYDRTPFDNLARRVHALYGPTDADIFRVRLDRRLRDRHVAPIEWDAEPPSKLRRCSA
jgi:hypothetical protein